MEQETIERIEKLQGWGTIKQCQTLYDFIVGTKAKVSVDIGVFGGRFLYAMAMAHKKTGIGKAYGIDPWAVDPCLEGTNDVANADYWSKIDFNWLFVEVTQLMIDQGLVDYSNILRFKSQEVWPLFTQIDVLSIDGNHSPEVSCQDVSIWAPLVREGGYIHFDDANWPSTQDAQALILNYGFEEIMFIEEGDGRDWKIYRKLSKSAGENVDVTNIILEAKY